MRKLAIIFIALSAVACSTMKPTQRTSLSIFSDYREYAQQGFLISPSPYTYDFESVGEISIVVRPAKEVKTVPVYPGSINNTQKLVYEELSYDELVKMAVTEAKSKGADALVNFSITKEYVRNAQGYEIEMYYNITGFCIKRK